MSKKKPVIVTPELVARTCHELNRAYCEALGDRSQVPWEEAPEWQRESALVGVQLHLGNPEAGPEASHQSWMEHKKAEGWRYGPKKDTLSKQHPCMVPFNKLPVEQRAKDHLFKAVVGAWRPMVGLALVDPKVLEPVKGGKSGGK